MTYIYDIIVNFVDGDRLVEFFEWDNRDVIEHVKRVPLVRVDEEVFFDFIGREVVVSDAFLSLIKGKTSFFSECRSDYVVLISNGMRAYAFEFSSDGSVLCRSSLLLDEEDEIVLISKELSTLEIKYQSLGDRQIVHNSTRREDKNRHFVRKEIEIAFNDGDIEKLNYMYSECFNDTCSDLTKIYQKLLNSLDDDSYLKKLSYIFRLSHKNEKFIK